MSYNQSNEGWRNNRRGGRGRGRGRGGRGGRGGGRGRNAYQVQEGYENQGRYDRRDDGGRNYNRRDDGGRNYNRNQGRGQGRDVYQSQNQYQRSGYDDRRNNRGRGGRGGRGRARGRGRGRGGRGRGRGGGRGRGRGRNDKRNDYWGGADASETLNNNVKKFNELDQSGPQQVKIWKYAEDGWCKVQSLSTGNNYFFQMPSHAQLNIGEIPAVCVNKLPASVEYQDQGSRSCLPPKQSVFNMNELRKYLLPNVRTNSFPLSNNILENTVQSYDVSFDPPISTTDSVLRHKVLFGSNRKQQRINKGIIFDYFGKSEFDNHVLYAMGGRKRDKSLNTHLQLSKEYIVKFQWLETCYLSNLSLPISQREALLNIFNRKKMMEADYTRVGRGWFYKKPHPWHPKMKPITIGNDRCRVLMGYDCKIKVVPNEKSVQAIFKADLTSRLLSGKTVHEIISEILMDYGNKFDRAFHAAVNAYLVGKYFVTTYNSMSNRIERINFKENENGKFALRSGGKISYKKYLETYYSGLKSPLKEICVIVDQRGSKYLPQHSRLTVKSEEVADVYEEVLDATNVNIKDRMERVDALVQHLNITEDKMLEKQKQELLLKAKEDAKHKELLLKKLIQETENINKNTNNNADDAGDDNKDNIPDVKPVTKNTKCIVSAEVKDTKEEDDEEEDATDDDFKGFVDRFHITGCIMVNALKLQYPKITFCGRQGNITQRVDQMKWGGRQGTAGFLKGVHVLREWCIVSDFRSQWRADKLYSFWEAYCGMRGFYDWDENPIQEPEMRCINLSDQSQFLQLVKERPWQMILLVLPNGEFGSKIKAEFTKLIQSKKKLGNRVNGCLLQCVIENNATNKNAVLGCFEDIMAKIGNILFTVDPCLPHGKQFIDVHRCWSFGLDISHNKRKPSVCMLTLQTRPFDGTMRGMRCSAHLNENRVEIVPFAAMTTMVFQTLMSAWVAIGKNASLLPKCIFLFRDGVPDNALREVHSKEVVGVLRGIRLAKDAMGAVAKKWKPKLEFIVVCKSPIDKFGQMINRGKSIGAIYHPCVIFNGVTSDTMWDFFIWPYHPNRNIQRTKPLRYIVLRDELKLSAKENSNAPWDLFQFIHATLFTYAFSIPFPMGGTSQPGPIKYAKHYAETFAQMILGSDQKLADLQTANNLSTRPHVIEKLVHLPDLMMNGGSGSNKANVVKNVNVNHGGGQGSGRKK